MKKVLIGLGLAVVLVVGAAIFLVSNLDAIVETAIENYGTEAVGSNVEVGSIDINLTEGSAAVYDFSVANPQGFSNQAMMSFSEVSVAIDIATLRDPVITIDSIVARQPYVLYESVADTTNIDVVSQRFASDEEADDADEAASDSEIQLNIVSILIEDIQAQMAGDGVPDLNINLGDIALQNLQGTPEQIAEQIMGPVTRQISANAASALIEATAGMITDTLESATESLENIGDSLGEGLEENLGEVGDALEEGLEGLGDLFGN